MGELLVVQAGHLTGHFPAASGAASKLKVS
jgi:hypothetical protein